MATIAEKTYNAVLKAVDSIVGAIVWVFNAIKTAIEAIIRFLKFLFQWKDIKRTKEVLHNVVMLYLRHQVDGIDTARTAFDYHMDNVADKISEWGGITDWSSLGDTASAPPDKSGKDPTSDHDSTSLLFANHYRGQAEKIQVKSALPELKSHAEAEELIDVLLGAISEQGEALSDLYEQIQDLATSFKELSVEGIIKRIASILIRTLVSSVKIVVDALLRVLSALGGSALDILDAKLHIPIISDILNAIGIPDISFMDLFCWIGAVGYTVVYKIINGEAPFRDTSDVKAIIAANSWSELSAVFNRKQAIEMDANKSGDKEPSEDLNILQKLIHSAGHGISGFVLFMTTFSSSAEALYLLGDNPWGTPAAVLGVIIAGSQGVAASLAPRHPVENAAVDAIAKATTVTNIVCSLLFSGPVQEKLAMSGSSMRGLIVNDGRATGAVVKSILVAPALFVTGWHFYELSKKSASQERSVAIIGEVTNIASYTATISYAVAVNLKDPPSKTIPVAVMAAANATGGGLQTARAALPH